MDHWISKRVSVKHLLLLYWRYQSLWLCGSLQTAENSLKDGNTRPPDPPAEKSVCRSRNNIENWTRSNRLVPNWERSMSSILSPCLFNLYAECVMSNAGLDEARTSIKIARKITITSDTQMTAPLWQKEKSTKEPLDESERGDWKCWLKTQHSEN